MQNIYSRHIVRLVLEEDALAVTEYAVMLSLIVIAALGAITALGAKMNSVFRFEYEALDQFVQ
jgi:Flp pilus assembly pilin Flp